MKRLLLKPNPLGCSVITQGTDFAHPVEIRRGAVRISAEETALFEAIEGKRGFPRVKPPYPTTHGVFFSPTAINNVETLCATPAIVLHGADWYRQWGEGKYRNQVVSMSGSGHRGVYEIPRHYTAQLLDDPWRRAGDLRDPGGAAELLTPDETMRLTKDCARLQYIVIGR
jgi:NADH:ubiquinone oxidoreductase subunit F (NADH-binding)